MYFEQFYLGCLAHASYMVGSAGLAAVVDPQRDVDQYLDEARAHGLRIAHVIETHLHADFVSGHRELAERAGAQIYLGASSGATFPHVPVRDGDEITFGHARLQFLETPGHTEESLCALLTDRERSPDPFAVFTGDTLFIGDVGRPDLSPALTPKQLAALLYRSLHQKLLRLPDEVQVYPAHGAGSLCGRNISSDRFSTIGRERATNYALQSMTETEFVEMLTAHLPERPGYFALDVELNRSGAAPVAELAPLPALDAFAVLERQQRGAVVLDTRPAAPFGVGHVPGSIHIALSGQFASWAGTILGLDVDIILVAEDEARVAESRLRLARVGIERVIGCLEGGMEAWKRAYLPLAQIPQIEVRELHRLLAENPDKLVVLDVRGPGEWQEGHLEPAVLKPLNQLPRLLDELDPRRPIAVHCKGGYRSSIAASLLQRAGFQHLMNVAGGFDAWKAANLPVSVPDPARQYVKTWSSNRAEHFQERQVSIAGWDINVTSYRLGDLWHAKADNVSPGAVVARASGPTRSDAESTVVIRATQLLRPRR